MLALGCRIEALRNTVKNSNVGNALKPPYLNQPTQNAYTVKMYNEIGIVCSVYYEFAPYTHFVCLYA